MKLPAEHDHVHEDSMIDLTIHSTQIASQFAPNGEVLNCPIGITGYERTTMPLEDALDVSEVNLGTDQLIKDLDTITKACSVSIHVLISVHVPSQIF